VWVKIYPAAAGTGTATYVGHYGAASNDATEVDSGGVDQTTYPNATQTPYDNATEFPDGQPVIFWPIPVDPASMWVVPAGPASATFYGYVTTLAQSIKGGKSFIDFVEVNTSLAAGYALSASDNYDVAFVVWSSSGAYSVWTDRQVGAFTAAQPGVISLYGGVTFVQAEAIANAANSTVFRASNYPGADLPTDQMCHKDSAGTTRRLSSTFSGTKVVAVGDTVVIEDGHIVSWDSPP
jgi:hypothetical protein